MEVELSSFVETDPTVLAIDDQHLESSTIAVLNLKIIDTGTGIPEEKWASVFLPYSQIRAGEFQQVQTLIAQGVDPDLYTTTVRVCPDPCARSGVTPLPAHFACRLALQHGTTALIAAVEKGHTATVRVLLEAGANPSVKNDLGEEPLALAKSHGHKDIMLMLPGAPLPHF